MPPENDTTTNAAEPTTPPEEITVPVIPGEGQAAGSSADFDSKLTALEAKLERKHQEEIATLRAQYEEEQRKTRQSLRSVGDSIVARVQERLGSETRIIDEWEQARKITPEEADSERLRARNRIEREETQRQRDQDVRSQRQSADQENARANRAMLQALRSSGLVEGDPEAASLPEEVPDGLTPDQAVQWYGGEVEKLKGQKAQRLAREQTEKEAKVKTDLAAAQAAAAHVDLGGGAAALPGKELPDDLDELWKLAQSELEQGGVRHKQ